MIIKNNTGCDLVIFGTKGDLAQRKLFPALYQLEKYKKIHKDTRIIGVGRSDWNIKEYKKFVKTAIKKFLKQEMSEIIWNILSTRLFFCNIDVNNKINFLQLNKIFAYSKNIIIYYCAMPPNTFANICQGLGYANLNTISTRIIIEKPLGNCLKTSREINYQIAKYFKESQIFRIDHYLGKEAILNLFYLRFANSFFFHNWNNQNIDHVQITVSEDIGIENRWNYFNQTGQMRDMVQNHLLQILTILTMSQPINLQANSIRNEKVKILRALRRIKESQINIKTATGQYTHGTIKGEKVKSYQEESGIYKKTKTETFVAIKVNIDTDSWYGVPFYLRTGKRLAYKYSEIVIYFKKISMNIFHNNTVQIPLNKLIIRLEPTNNITIHIVNKLSELNQEYQFTNLILESKETKKFQKLCFIDAYERLLLESMQGNQSLFVSLEEVEEAWKWIDPIILGWQTNKNYHPQLYVSGTWGPNNSNNIINCDGRFWNLFS